MLSCPVDRAEFSAGFRLREDKGFKWLSLEEFCRGFGRVSLCLLQTWAKSFLDFFQVVGLQHLHSIDVTSTVIQSSSWASLTIKPRVLRKTSASHLGCWLLHAAIYGEFVHCSLEHLEMIKDPVFRSFLHQCFNPCSASVDSLLKHRFLQAYLGDCDLHRPVALYHIEVIEEKEEELLFSNEVVEVSVVLGRSYGYRLIEFYFTMHCDSVNGVALELAEALGLGKKDVPYLEAVIEKGVLARVS